MKNLRQARKYKGYSLKNLSDLSGQTVPHLSWIETGKVPPSLITRTRLGEILGEPVNWLDTPFEVIAREPAADWEHAEREFRILLKSIKSLEADEQAAFIHTAKKHLTRMSKQLNYMKNGEVISL